MAVRGSEGKSAVFITGHVSDCPRGSRMGAVNNTSHGRVPPLSWPDPGSLSFLYVAIVWSWGFSVLSKVFGLELMVCRCIAPFPNAVLGLGKGLGKTLFKVCKIQMLKIAEPLGILRYCTRI